MAQRSHSEHGENDHSRQVIDKESLVKRADTYLLGHYLGLHYTIVSVALAIAGLALASLLGTSRIYRADYALLWLLFLASFLCIAVIYAGVVSSAIVAPARMPLTRDLLPPLLLGLTEFMLFGVLAHQATGLTRTQSVVAAWFFSFTAYCLLASIAVIRARQLIDHTAYEEALQCQIGQVRKALLADIIAALIMALVGLSGALIAAQHRAPTLWLYVLAFAVISALCYELIKHTRTAKLVQALLAGGISTASAPKISQDPQPASSGNAVQTEPAPIANSIDRPTSNQTTADDKQVTAQEA